MTDPIGFVAWALWFLAIGGVLGYLVGRIKSEHDAQEQERQEKMIDDYLHGRSNHD